METKPSYFDNKLFRWFKNNSCWLSGTVLALLSFAGKGLFACFTVKALLNFAARLSVETVRFTLSTIDGALGALFGMDKGLLGPGVYEPVERHLKASIMLDTEIYIALFFTVFIAAAVWFFAFSGGTTLCQKIFKRPVAYRLTIRDLGACTLPSALLSIIAACFVFICLPVSLLLMMMSFIITVGRTHTMFCARFPGMGRPASWIFALVYILCTALSLASLALIALFI